MLLTAMDDKCRQETAYAYKLHRLGHISNIVDKGNFPTDFYSEFFFQCKSMKNSDHIFDQS